MTSTIWFPRMASAVFAVLCLTVAAQPGTAAEEAKEFLRRLHEEQMFDVALDYLEQMRTSNLVDGEFREAIDYEVGLTWIESALRSSQSTSAREKSLGSAREALQKFLKEHPQHPKVSSANRQIAGILSARAKIKMDQCAKPTTSAAKKKSLNVEARELYSEAKKSFVIIEKQLRAERDKYKTIDPKDRKLASKRVLLNYRLFRARLELPQVTYYISRTYEPGSEENKKELTEAAKQYAALYEKYASFPWALFALIGEGRCYKELGEYEKAFEVFKDVEADEDESDFGRARKNEALVLQLETSLLPKVKKHKEAVAAVEKWEKKARSNERSNADGLAIQYLGGLAALEYAKTLEPKDKARRDSIKLAKNLLGEVAQLPGNYKRKAQTTLLEPELSGGGEVELAEPTNFAEASDRAKMAWDRRLTLDLQIQEAKAQGNTENLEKQTEQHDKACDEAVKYYRLALAMQTPEIALDEINVVRYYLCHLHWLRGELYDAAVYGEFLTNKYPSSPGAKSGASIAMAAYGRLRNEAGDDDAFEFQHMVTIAKRIAATWEGDPEADNAWFMLVHSAVISDNLEEAQKYLDNISPDSPKRGEAEIMFGQKAWGSYVKAMRLPEGDRPPQAEMDELLAKARKSLGDGLVRVKKAVEDDGRTVSQSMAAAVLSYAHVCLRQGAPQQAITWLEDPTIGALTLVKAGDPATQAPRFDVEAYKAALRAHVANVELDKAKIVMGQLEEKVKQSGDADADMKLTGIYISLGAELQKKVNTLREENKTAELKTVSNAFELFLEKISKQSAGNTFSSLNWVASTFAALGAGYDTGGTPSAESKRYYGKATDAYRAILAKCDADPAFAPQPTAILTVRIKLATCLRRTGKYADALRELLKVLQEKETMVDAQIQAAYTYQDWATEEPTYYIFAMTGSRKHKEIWGWGVIAKRVARVPKYRPVFHEALYNRALCRKEYALSKTGEARNKLLEQTERDIVKIQNIYPKMGGETRRDKYDKLLRSIQKLLRKNVSGLKPLGSTPKSTK